jgi:hypothetical protein
MFTLTKHILIEYWTLVVKMFEDQLAINANTKLNYEVLCDYGIILWLTCVLPMLEVVQSLSKLAQGSSIHLFAT